MPMEIHEDKIVMRAGKYNLPKPWQDLTDDEITKLRHLIDWTAGWSYIEFARAVEALLKEKNA